MPADEMYEMVPLTRSERLNVDAEQSAGSKFLSDAYKWGTEHKLELGLAVGAAAIAIAAGRLVSGSRRAMAEYYGPTAELSANPAAKLAGNAETKFVVHDNSVLGGRIGVAPESSAVGKIGAAGPSDQGLNAPLHEIPHFGDIFGSASKGASPLKLPIESATGALTRGVLR